MWTQQPPLAEHAEGDLEQMHVCLFVQQTFTSLSAHCMLCFTMLSAGETEVMFICVNPEQGCPVGLWEGGREQSRTHQLCVGRAERSAAG